jgi:hypothetical protein
LSKQFLHKAYVIIKKQMIQNQQQT